MSVVANALELSRWQFATTTLYHFTFVPLTLGLAPLLAIMQTLAYRTKDEKWERLVDASPAAQADACGNGVAVIGSVSTAKCNNTQNATTGGNTGNSSLVDVSPAAQADACGNGVAVIGSGSTAECTNGQ